MDLLIAWLIFVIVGVVGLFTLRVNRKKRAAPGLVKCPKCGTGSTFEDIACPNCGNKKLKIKAAKVEKCGGCEIAPAKLPCPKCGCDITQLLLKANP
jgi:hypothetical protein